MRSRFSDEHEVVEQDAEGSGGPQDDVDLYFSTLLRRLREERGMSQEDLARAMKEHGFRWHQTTVYRVESNGRSVRLAEAAALAAILEVPIGYLVGEGERRPETDELLSLVNRFMDQQASLLAAWKGLEEHRHAVDVWVAKHGQKLPFEVKTADGSRSFPAELLAHAQALAGGSAVLVINQAGVAAITPPDTRRGS